MFTTEEGARDAAIAQVDANAAPQFHALADAALLKTAQILPEFTVDDVWTYMPEEKITHDNRAMGAVITRAVKNRLIEHTGRTSKSRRKHCHCHPRSIWRSLVAG